MRKTIFTALVTLLVMLVVISCDNGLGTDKFGDGLVTLNIKSDGPIFLPANVTPSVTSSSLPTNVPTGISRSLTTANAQEKKAYVEVIFQNTGTPPTGALQYYRAAGPYKVITGGIDLKVKVYKGQTYNALILIGSDDGTLLATGKPEATSGSSTVTVLDDATIIFYVNPLKSNISAITAGSVAPDFSIDATPTWASTVETTAPDKFVNGPSVFKPCFLAPANTTDVKATLTINGFGNFTPSGKDSITGTGTDIFVKTAPTVTFTQIGSAPPIASSDISSITPVVSSAITTAGQLKFNFTTTAPGQYEITFKIPVVGFATNVPGGLTWNIQGGTTTGLDFTGTGLEDAIALLVTDDDPNMGTISVGTPAWQP